MVDRPHAIIRIREIDWFRVKCIKERILDSVIGILSLEIEDLIIGDVEIGGFMRFLYVGIGSLWVLIVDSEQESVLVQFQQAKFILIKKLLIVDLVILDMNVKDEREDFLYFLLGLKLFHWGLVGHWYWGERSFSVLAGEEIAWAVEAFLWAEVDCLEGGLLLCSDDFDFLAEFLGETAVDMRHLLVFLHCMIEVEVPFLQLNVFQLQLEHYLLDVNNFLI